MSRLIIDNRSDIPDEDAVRYALSVVKQGRISNYGKEYCYVTTFRSDCISGETVVASVHNKESDRLIVSRG